MLATVGTGQALDEGSISAVKNSNRKNLKVNKKKKKQPCKDEEMY
jgi:hypothetical protein